MTISSATHLYTYLPYTPPNMTPPRSTFLSAAVSALLLCLGEAEALRNGSVGGIVDATTFFKEASEVLSVPLRRVDQDGVATPSLARRFFKTDVLGVFGAAYLAQCESPPLAGAGALYR